MNKKNKIAVLGAGYGFYEILPLIEAINRSNTEKIEIVGILDDNPSIKKLRITRLLVLYLLGLSWIKAYLLFML